MLAYCDYIASQIFVNLNLDAINNPLSKMSKVDGVKMDLHPEEGYFVSTKKTLEVIDINGKKYKVTVEEV